MPDAEIVVISDDEKPKEGDVPMPGQITIGGTELQPEVHVGMQQSYASSHEGFLGVMAFAHAGHQVLNECMRWTMQAAASGQIFLASGILAQRSAQAQPQSPGGAGRPGVPGQLPGT